MGYPGTKRLGSRRKCQVPANYAIGPELCAEPTANGLLWPGIDGPMTNDRADALKAITPVYLDDRFLEKYEQSGLRTTTQHSFNSFARTPLRVIN